MSETLQYNTLWDILENIGIEIPPIQRDYAQGREIAKVDKIRNEFLDSIIHALDENKSLSLDFVYGKIHGLKNEVEHARNKQAIQSLLNTLGDYASSIDLKLENAIVVDKACTQSDFVYLIPLDGQQRLTTLFLLHWYIAKRLGYAEAITILSRFRYKTRKSSSSFLKLLTDLNTKIEFTPETCKKEKVSEGAFFESLKNNENFSMVWLADPTVHAMMVMLQEIHYKLQYKLDGELQHYWNGLVNDQLINFSFLDLKDFNLSDELYVKMNGRGKQLSTFENFKAWLFGVIEDEHIIDSTLWNSYKQKFDIDWNDLFWKYKADGVYDIDNAYFNYFKISLLQDAVKKVEIEKNRFNINSKLTTLINIIYENSEFEWENFKHEILKHIKSYFEFLTFFEESPSNKYLYSFSKSTFGTPELLTWQNLIRNYITYSFIKSKDKSLALYTNDDYSQLDEYHRVMFNLLDNTIIDNQYLYHLAYLEIDELNAKLKSENFNIKNWIETFEYSTKSVFTEQQILEEILKCRLMVDSNWKELIHEAEQVLYFERQLNFWFFHMGLSLQKEEFQNHWLNDVSLKEKFKTLTGKIKKMFTDEGINRQGEFSERVFERALLSKADYLLNEKGYKCFGRDSGRDVSWKRLFFRDRNSQATNEALKEIFDLDFTNVKSVFEQYINQNLSSTSAEKWRRTFIVNPELFNYLGNYKYIRNIDNHGWVIIKDGYKTYIGEHFELFSLDFYLCYLKGNIIQPFYKIDYYAAAKNSLEDFPCAYMNWRYNNVEYAIDIRYLQNKYQLIFFARNTNEIEPKIENELRSINLIQDKQYFYITFDESVDCYDKILEIGKKLLTL